MYHNLLLFVSLLFACLSISLISIQLYPFYLSIYFPHLSPSSLTQTHSLSSSLSPQSMNVSNSSLSTPGLPPSISESFLDQNSSIGAVFLADFDTQYTNQYDQSIFDLPNNLNASSLLNLTTYPNLCLKSTYIARSLYIELGGLVNDSLALSTDCSYIDEVMNCLLFNINCQLFTSIGISLSTPLGFSTPSHYSSVWYPMPDSSITSLSTIILNLLIYPLLISTNQSQALNASLSLSPSPVQVPIFYHDALDPNLLYNPHSSIWSILPNNNQYPIYMESNWDTNINMRTYQIELPSVKLITCMAGLGVAGLSFAGIFYMKKMAFLYIRRI
jgi:hypothetical protein